MKVFIALEYFFGFLTLLALFLLVIVIFVCLIILAFKEIIVFFFGKKGWDDWFNLAAEEREKINNKE